MQCNTICMIMWIDIQYTWNQSHHIYISTSHVCMYPHHTYIHHSKNTVPYDTVHTDTYLYCTCVLHNTSTHICIHRHTKRGEWEGPTLTQTHTRTVSVHSNKQHAKTQVFTNMYGDFLYWYAIYRYTDTTVGFSNNYQRQIIYANN